MTNTTKFTKKNKLPSFAEWQEERRRKLQAHSECIKAHIDTYEGTTDEAHGATNRKKTTKVPKDTGETASELFEVNGYWFPATGVHNNLRYDVEIVWDKLPARKSPTVDRYL